MDELQIVSAVLQIAGRYSLSRSCSASCNSNSDADTSKSDLRLSMRLHNNSTFIGVFFPLPLYFDIIHHYMRTLSPYLNISSHSSSRRCSPVRRRRWPQWRQQRWLGWLASRCHCAVRLVAPQHGRTSRRDNNQTTSRAISVPPLLFRHSLLSFVTVFLFALFFHLRMSSFIFSYGFQRCFFFVWFLLVCVYAVPLYASVHVQ